MSLKESWRGWGRAGFGAVVAGRPDGAIRRRMERAGVRYEPVDFVGNLAAPRHDGRALRRLAGLAREPEVALVHAHAQKAGVLARLAALNTGRPAVYTPHSLVYATQLVRARARRSCALPLRATGSSALWAGAPRRWWPCPSTSARPPWPRAAWLRRSDSTRDPQRCGPRA